MATTRVTVDGGTFELTRMNTVEQQIVLLKIGPALAGCVGLIQSMVKNKTESMSSLSDDMIINVVQAMRLLTHEDIMFVNKQFFTRTHRVVNEKRIANPMWMGNEIVEDITLITNIKLLWEHIKYNFDDFFRLLQLDSSEVPQ